MHPGFYSWWNSAREHDEGASTHCHPGHGGQRGRGRGHRRGYWAGGRGRPDFGVRRPLRFMTHKLELDDEQVQQLARILNDLKTERAQRGVDEARALGHIADALDAESFDRDKAQQALDTRVKSTQQVENAVLEALVATHGLLNAEQRTKLAYMLRSGQLTI